MFISKFHCELNPIERMWGQAKVFSHNIQIAHSHDSMPSTTSPLILSALTLYLRKAQDYDRAYLEGKQAGKELEQAVKVTRNDFLEC